MRRALLAPALALAVAGCGGPGKPPAMTKPEVKAFGDLSKVRPPFGGEGEGKPVRAWPPAVEAVYQKALALPNPNHVIAVEWGVFGPQMYDAYILAWDSSGPFRTVRAHLPFDDIENPRWLEGELPREEGEALLGRLGDLSILRLQDDRSLKGKVHGAGWVRYRARIGSRENEFLVWAPYRLARTESKPRYKKVLLELLEVVPGQE